MALGLDLPLGLPLAYARHLPDSGFPAFLRRLAGRPAFFQVCATLAEVAADRPFYPMHGRRGMTRAAHAAALGLAGAADLSRCCDRATAERPAGAPLFWTLGANQTGKAAIAGWRDMLLPAFAAGEDVRLWPFDGPFRSLLAPVPWRLRKPIRPRRCVISVCGWQAASAGSRTAPPSPPA